VGTPEVVIAGRSFTEEDQREFARASGDRNPIHIDPVAARRTAAGATVVHGMHAVLWALESLLAGGAMPYRPGRLDVRFKRFVPVGAPLRLVRRDRAGQVRVVAMCRDMPSIQVTLAPGPSRIDADLDATGLAMVEPGVAPLEPAREAMAASAGRLGAPADPSWLAARFPRCAATLGPGVVGSLARLSTLVGMVCPGLHSVFSGLVVDLAPADDAGLGFRCTAIDWRFGLVELAVAGPGIAGAVQAFVRQPPVPGIAMREAVAMVDPSEFAGLHAWVIGGSRGLGAASAKLLAAGGARVWISHAAGREDALGVAADIASARGRGACETLHFDVRQAPGEQLRERLPPIDQVYYFASPTIHRQKAAGFSQALFEEFRQYYVDGLRRTVCHEALRPRRDVVGVFYPSSAFIDSRPAGFAEYVAAKLAGETLCLELEREVPHVRCISERLPPVLTDQNAGAEPGRCQDAARSMLPHLRSMRRLCGGADARAARA